MEYASTAHNRSIYAAPAGRRLGVPFRRVAGGQQRVETVGINKSNHGYTNKRNESVKNIQRIA
jgi:hypothetical protein